MLRGDVNAFRWTVLVIQVACTSDTALSWGRGIRIGIYCTLSDVLKILTGSDQVSIYFLTDRSSQSL